MTKKKQVVVTIPTTGQPRELAQHRVDPIRKFPRASELSQRSDWTQWLRGATRAVLGPAAIATALATGGCDTVGEAYANVLSPPTQVEPVSTQPSCTLEPIAELDAPDAKPGVGNALPIPPPPGTPGHAIVTGQKPPGYSPGGTPSVTPRRHPPGVRGGRRPIRPVTRPIAVPGGI